MEAEESNLLLQKLKHRTSFLFSRQSLDNKNKCSQKGHLNVENDAFVADACQGTAIVGNTRSGNILSPNYPNDYPNNANCKWWIQAWAGEVSETGGGQQIFVLRQQIFSSFGKIFSLLHSCQFTWSPVLCGRQLILNIKLNLVLWPLICFP